MGPGFTTNWDGGNRMAPKVSPHRVGLVYSIWLKWCAGQPHAWCLMWIGQRIINLIYNVYIAYHVTHTIRENGREEQRFQ